VEAGTGDPGGAERHCPSNGVRKAKAHLEPSADTRAVN